MWLMRVLLSIPSISQMTMCVVYGILTCVQCV